MKKKCQRCKKSFKLRSMRGSARVKFCYACRPAMRKEYQVKAESKRNEARLTKNGNIIAKDCDLTFYGYKEPLKKYTPGYGYYGVVSYNKERDKVQCHICGRLFKNVGSHAALLHGIGKQEYKKQTGLAMTTALVGEGTRNALIMAHKDVKSFSQRGKTRKQVIAHMTKMAHKGRKTGTKWSLERRNQEGNCPEQLIDRIKKLQVELKRRPTAKEYQRKYGTYASIITVYGKWNIALKMASGTTFSEEKAMKTDPDFLLDHMKNFYKRFKRSPRTSDMRRGLLPCHQVYCKVFGTLNDARRLAKIPVVLPLSKYNYVEVPSKIGNTNSQDYAIWKMAQRV